MNWYKEGYDFNDYDKNLPTVKERHYYNQAKKLNKTQIKTNKMSYELKGTIKVISDTQVISDAFSKREFVVTDSSGKYEQTIQLQLIKDNCTKLDNFSVGDSVNVSFNLKGREWTNPKDGKLKFFNSLDAWKIEPANNGQSTEQPTAEQMGDDSDEDLLPF